MFGRGFAVLVLIMQEKDAQQLLKKYLAGRCTSEETALLETWYMRQEGKELPEIPQQVTEQQMAEVWDQLPFNQPKVRRIWPRIAAAASVIIAIGFGGYFLLHKTSKRAQQIVQLKPGTFKNDAQAGNKAILTLGNGKQIAVTSIPTGQLANTAIQKTNTGALKYQQSDAAPDEYNTFTVPRGGGKHELYLADGTLVVLDAESSIRYPVAFNGKDRKVTITGQVYFEVVHKAAQPFYVTVGDQTIQDVGTHFNVNAFDGEIKTTLIEGSIKVNDILLKPGQQAVQANAQISINTNVDEEEVLAWKNDLFKFGNNTSLQTVMNQLSRWYDLDVQYEGSSKQYHFGGYVPRNSKLSEVCKILEYSGVKFSLDGKKITVYQ